MSSATTAGDDPIGEVDPAKVFAGLLRELQTESGGPSVRELEALFEEIEIPFSKSSIQDKLTGRTAPDFVFVEAFVKACALHAGVSTPDLGPWRTSLKQMRRDLKARSGPPRAREVALPVRAAVPRSFESVAKVIPVSVHDVSDQPSLLLRADRRIVDFIGRRRELADLVAWCEDDSAGRLRLVTGAGGVGKTRLAVELSHGLSAAGWSCFEVLEGTEGQALATIRQSESGRVLILVDYAETRLGLKQLLRAVVTDEGARLRVLLLARSAGAWWQQFSGMDLRVRDLTSGAHYELGPLVEDQVSDAEIVRMAAPALAAEIDVEVGEVTFAEGPRRARILDLLVATLAALLTAKEAGSAAHLHVDLQGSIPKLIEHEQRFWIGSAERAELLSGPDGLAPETLRRVVAAGCLLGATSETEAVQLLTRVPNIRTQLKVALWLRELYPPEPGSGVFDGMADWLGTLQPDRLAEFHIATELEASPELANNCLTSLDLRQALRAYTLLSRASTDYPSAYPLFEQMLLMVGPLARPGMDLPAEVLMVIADGMPYPGVALTIVHNAVARYFDEAPFSAGPQWDAWLTTLSAYLTRLASLVENFPPNETSPGLGEARRAMHVSYPETARALAAIGWLAPTEEAVAIYRGLSQTYPKYRLALTRCLFTLSAILANAGSPAEAENARKEASAELKLAKSAWEARRGRESG